MKKFFKVFGIILLILVVILGVWFLNFYLSHKESFYPKTMINEVNVSNTTLDIAQSLIADTVLDKNFIITSNGKELAKLNLEKDLDAKLNFRSELQRIFTDEKDLSFLDKIQTQKDYTIELAVDIQQSTIMEALSNFDFMKKENQTTSQDAYIDFISKETTYKIIPESIGTEVNEEKLYQTIIDKINKEEYTIDLAKEEMYILPKVTSTDTSLVKVVDEINQYLNTKITYNFGDRTEIVDKNIIKNFVNLSKENIISINEDKITEYIDNLAQTYDSVGITRTFKSSKRGDVIISGGDYGYKIDKDAEFTQLLSEIKEGKIIEREPIYSQSGLMRQQDDIGNTYVEVDLSNQHIWFYYEGTLIIESDCVTGTNDGVHATPPGVYALKYKERDAVLRGDKKADGTYGYESPVSYWMPFNGGIGLHDATWRNNFGGSIYQTSGSHGCVNLPFDTAATIYERIEKGTPVILYQ